MNEGSKKILIVDDDKDVVMLLSIHMEMAGYESFTALDGRSALRIAKRYIPDLVILDLMLPEFDGWEVCRCIKRDANMKTIPVLILSALSDAESRSKAITAGADEFMTKPFSPKELVLRIAQLMETRRAQEPSH